MEVISGARSSASHIEKLPKMGLSDAAHRHLGHGALEKSTAGHLHTAQGSCGSLPSPLRDVGQLACFSAPGTSAATGP